MAGFVAYLGHGQGRQFAPLIVLFQSLLKTQERYYLVLLESDLYLFQPEEYPYLLCFVIRFATNPTLLLI